MSEMHLPEIVAAEICHAQLGKEFPRCRAVAL